MKRGLLLVLIIAILVSTGVILRDADQGTPSELETQPESIVETEETASEVAQSDIAATEAVTEPAPVTVSTDQLTDGQQRLLRMLGVDTDNFVITAAMQACAAEKVGAGRLDEIIAGDTPSVGEGIALVGCYRE